tara:strand:+ start:2895 stop:3503 length:609 start_codon:yes stop_codon:yes gene_type:complete
LANSSKSKYKKADYFSRLAKSAGYRSRSSIKLLEILRKDHFIKKNAIVLDLGCYPGGWSQVSSEIVGNKGKVVGVDIRLMNKICGVKFLHKDIKELVKKDFRTSEGVILPFDVVLSDIAPNISGITYRDDALMVELLNEVKVLINYFLRHEGAALVKVFQGKSFDDMMIFMKTRFQKVRIRKPKASRKNSKETYILGLDKKI